MADAVAHIALMVLCLQGLCLGLLDLPVPRKSLGAITGLLLFIQAGVLSDEENRPVLLAGAHRPLIRDLDEGISACVVAPLTALTTTVLVLYLLEARRAHIARLKQAMGAD